MTDRHAPRRSSTADRVNDDPVTRPSVNDDPVTRPSVDEIRQYHLQRLNSALRRPGMWGNEITIRVLMDAVAFVDGLDEAVREETDVLRTRRAFNALGVLGGVQDVLTGYQGHHDAVASVYAEIAWRYDWLVVDRLIPGDIHERLRTQAADWGARDRHLDEVLAELGPPSILCGGSNPHCAKTLAYATDGVPGLVSLHFSVSLDEPQPILYALRYGDGPFPESFVFTPFGRSQRIAG
jgi:hypothetical protein